MKYPRKYHYETETCGDCGHVTKRRVYHWPKAKYDGRVTRDIGPVLSALHGCEGPLTALLRRCKEKENNKPEHINWHEGDL